MRCCGMGDSKWCGRRPPGRTVGMRNEANFEPTIVESTAWLAPDETLLPPPGHPGRAVGDARTSPARRLCRGAEVRLAAGWRFELVRQGALEAREVKSRNEANFESTNVESTSWLPRGAPTLPPPGRPGRAAAGAGFFGNAALWRGRRYALLRDGRSLLCTAPISAARAATPEALAAKLPNEAIFKSNSNRIRQLAPRNRPVAAWPLGSGRRLDLSNRR